MKMFRLFAVLAAFLIAAPAFAQQVQNHAVPVGRGAGVTGFGAIAPGTSGKPLVSNGAAADPSFGNIANSGLTPGAANTLKGSLDGSNVVDTAVPACTAVSQALRWTAGVGFTCSTVSVTTGFDTPINLGLAVTAPGGGVLTINVTQANGSAPTSGNPVLVPFRSLTATTGTVAYSTISSALSLTVPSGATLGTSSSNVPFRVWIFLNANGGVPAIGVATCSNTTTIFPCASWESTFKTSITIDTAADVGGALYAAAGVTLDAVRIVGFCDFASGLVTAGTWASACTTLQVFGPGVRRPGDTVQAAYATSTTAATTSSATFAALASGVSVSVTPTSTVNLIRVTATGTMNVNTNAATGLIQLTRGTTPQIGIPVSSNTAGNYPLSSVLRAIDAPGTASSTTYSVYGKTTAGTLSYPPANTGVTLEAEEIMG